MVVSNQTCAIVVTFNRVDLLKECIQALNAQTEPVSHIIVINNKSTDNTEEYLRKLNEKLSNLIVVNSKLNLGGAGGFNLGLKSAYDLTSDDYFWLLDDDTIVEENANKNFIKHSVQLQNQYGFLISNVRWIDGTPANVMNTAQDWPALSNQGLIKVNYGSFVSFFVQRRSVSLVGYPITDFFIWGDDAEFSLRLRSLNDGYFMEDVMATHKSASKDVAAGVAYDSENRIDRYFYSYRNQLYIWKTYFPKKYKGVLIRKLLKSFSILFISNNHRIYRFKVAVSGIIHSVFFNPIVEKANKYTKK